MVATFITTHTIQVVDKAATIPPLIFASATPTKKHLPDLQTVHLPATRPRNTGVPSLLSGNPKCCCTGGKIILHQTNAQLATMDVAMPMSYTV
jgi:hypothetical protein